MKERSSVEEEAPRRQPAQPHSEAQRRYLSGLAAQYAAKTRGSKRLADLSRRRWADPQAAADRCWFGREGAYPLVVERAQGSRLWDVDGNEYLDLVNGEGCLLFGHSPDFLVDALQDQLERGGADGAQTALAGEVAGLICELTGDDRAAFCSSGAEAVGAALRLARAVTGRERVVCFAEAGCGTSGAASHGASRRSRSGSLAQVTDLEFGADASLEYLRRQDAEVAAVLVEYAPIRDGAPQPVEFLRTVRVITEQVGALLILDERATAFRLSLGGMQEQLGIRADLVTYGEVIGAGQPIGVLAGKRAYLDALEGGAWQCGKWGGERSEFGCHPLSLAAARAVLQHLRRAGPGLQRALNRRTARLTRSLDRFLLERGISGRVHHFASSFYFSFADDAPLGDLLYAALLGKGIHVQRGKACFLTAAHAERDVEVIECAVREAILEMQAAEILPSVCTSGERCARTHRGAASLALEQASLTEAQRGILGDARRSDHGNCALHRSLTLHLRGTLWESDLVEALDAVLERHDALHGAISAEGNWLRVVRRPESLAPFIDLRGLEPCQQQYIYAAAIEEEAGTAFDLARGPLIRATFYRLADDHAALLLTAHDLGLAGGSAEQLLEEVSTRYERGQSGARARSERRRGEILAGFGLRA